MTAINRTNISAIVNAVFNSNLNDRIKSATYSPYQIGLFAEQDYRAILSMIGTIRMDLVRMQDGTDTVLQDIPYKGARDHADSSTGAESDMEIERREMTKLAARAHAVLERHLDSLAKQAKADLEQAGTLVKSGSKYVLSTATRDFKAYGGSWEDFLIDLRANAKIDNVNWLNKIDRASEIEFPLVSAQDATDEFMDYFEDANVSKSSNNAWDRLYEHLEIMGRELAKHEEVVANFNALPPKFQDAAKTEFSVVCKDFKYAMKSFDWKLERMLEPWQLLCATGVSSDLIDSPEWRTKEAEKRIAAARARQAVTMAENLEIEVTNMEIESAIALKRSRARQAQLMAQQEELMAQLNPPVQAKASPAPAPEPEVQAQPEVVAVPKAHVPMAHLNGFKGAALNARGPRG